MLDFTVMLDHFVACKWHHSVTFLVKSKETQQDQKSFWFRNKALRCVNFQNAKINNPESPILPQMSHFSFVTPSFGFLHVVRVEMKNIQVKG